MGPGTNLKYVFDSDDSQETKHAFTSMTAIKRTPIQHIEVTVDPAKGASAFIEESGQAETPDQNVAIVTRLHAYDKASQSERKKMITAQVQAGNFGKESKGQRTRRKRREKKEKEAAAQQISVVEHLLDQAELSEEAHRSPTNFGESQDKVTPLKPPPTCGWWPFLRAHIR